MLRLATGGFALLFLAVGLAWWIAPGRMSDQFRMELLTGAGLSTQLADLASFFMTLGGLMFCGLVSNNRAWWYAALSLLAIALVGRLLAWGFHGADTPIDMMAVESVVITLLALNLRQRAAQAATPSAVLT